jgi:hypothetical protein
MASTAVAEETRSIAIQEPTGLDAPSEIKREDETLTSQKLHPGLFMLLTFATSERLEGAMTSWIPACVKAGFDIALMVSADEVAAKRVENLIPQDLADGVRMVNSYHITEMNESRSMERWKTWAYVKQTAASEFQEGDLGSAGRLFSGRRHQWFIQLDDDTIPHCAKTADYLNDEKILTSLADDPVRSPLYIGSGGDWRHFFGGWYVFFNREAFRMMSSQLNAQPPRLWADRKQCDPPYAYVDHDTHCCAVNRMKHADMMLGDCARKGGVKLTPDQDYHRWSLLYRHGVKKKGDIIKVFNEMQALTDAP